MLSIEPRFLGSSARCLVALLFTLFGISSVQGQGNSPSWPISLCWAWLKFRRICNWALRHWKSAAQHTNLLGSCSKYADVSARQDREGGGEMPEKYFKALFGPDLKLVPSERESGASHFCKFALYCAYMSESCCSNVYRQVDIVVTGFVLKCRILQHGSQCVSVRPKPVLILYRRT